MFPYFRSVRQIIRSWFTSRKHRPTRNQEKRVRLLLEPLEDRLAPATFSNTASSVELYATVLGASMDIYKSGANQIQVVLGSGDLWQGTDDPTGGITGNGLATLTINTSLFTGTLMPGTFGTNTGTLTIHGTATNGAYPSIQADWAGNIVIIDGTFASNGFLDLYGGGSITVNAPIETAAEIQFAGPGGITINAAVQTEAITSDPVPENDEYYNGSGEITIASTAGPLYLNAPVSTGNVGTASQPYANTYPLYSGQISVTATTLIGNAQGTLTTGAVYAAVGYSSQLSLEIYGDVQMPAANALAVGYSLGTDDLGNNTGTISINAGGNVSSDGGTGPLSVNFADSDATTWNSTNFYVSNFDGTGTGNFCLNCTGDVELNAGALITQSGMPQTIDITTSGGDMLLYNLGNAIFDGGYDANQYAGDNVTLGTTTGTLIVDLSGYASSGPVVNFGAGNLTLIGNEINVTDNYNPNYLPSEEINDPDAIAGTGALLLEPGSAGRNIAIGGNNAYNPSTTLNLSTSDLGAFAPGFSSITIGQANTATGTVTEDDNITFASPTTIYGGSFANAGGFSVTTTSSNNLSLVAYTGPIGTFAAPVGATAGGNLYLSTAAGGATGQIFASSDHSLTLQQNVFATTGPGHGQIGLWTTTGDINVPSSEPVQSDDLFLTAAGNINVNAPNGLPLTAPALILSAGAALNLGPATTLTATQGNMTLASGTTPIGSGAQPLVVSVAGQLSLFTAGSAANADIDVTSAGASLLARSAPARPLQASRSPRHPATSPSTPAPP